MTNSREMQACISINKERLKLRKSMIRIIISLSSVMWMPIPSSAVARSTGRMSRDSLSDMYGACLYTDGKATGVRMDEPFAMHSIMKFPQAVFVAACMHDRGISLHESIAVRKEDLMQNTRSPMIKMLDKKREFSYAELLTLSLTQSDNNACDILFNRFGVPKKVEDYLHQLGFRDIHIHWTEFEMGLSPKRSVENNCTPKEMARLFEWLYQHKTQNEYIQFVWETMASCQTGTARIASIIPEGAAFIHKTGTGFPSKEKKQDRNDAGIIIMPDGTYRIVAIFVPQSTKEEDVASIGKKLLVHRELQDY